MSNPPDENLTPPVPNPASGNGDAAPSKQAVQPSAAAHSSYELLNEGTPSADRPLLTDEEEARIEEAEAKAQAARVAAQGKRKVERSGVGWGSSPFGVRRHTADQPPTPGTLLTFVKPGWGEPKPVALVGAGIALAAAIMAAVAAWNIGAGTALAAAVWVLYLSALHAATGTAAIAIVAGAEGRLMGNLVLAAARMFVAVALFLAPLPLAAQFGGWIVAVSAVAGYAAATCLLFRWPLRAWFHVAVCHAVFALVVWGTVQLHALAQPPRSAAPRTPAEVVQQKAAPPGFQSKAALSTPEKPAASGSADPLPSPAVPADGGKHVP